MWCRSLLLCIAFIFTSCGGCLQTQPTCVLDQYGIVHFYNFTETPKIGFIQRYDSPPSGKARDYPPLFQHQIEPGTMHVYRVYPGYYYVGVKNMEEEVQMWEASVSLCETVTIQMEITRPTTPDRIKSRRSVIE